ncbi:MAG: phosphoribosylformylglycinamidine synthase subunit PurQ, partial [Alphaproteobacteria bacterium]|nr:phosphoribosylformylglycinamidine synthase subunit PurQ [Alphaproteobacteria bacterium]
NDNILTELKEHDQIAFRYCDVNGDITKENPYGSTENIAGIYNKRKTILGMMPHPENVTLEHHNNLSGIALFKGICETLA